MIYFTYYPLKGFIIYLSLYFLVWEGHGNSTMKRRMPFPPLRGFTLLSCLQSWARILPWEMQACSIYHDLHRGYPGKWDENLATAPKCFPSISADNIIILIAVVPCSSTPSLQECHKASQHSSALLLPITHQCPAEHLLMALLWFKFGIGPFFLLRISNNLCLWERIQIIMWGKQSIQC